MKNKLVKKLIAVVTLTLACGMIAGCGNVVSDLTDTFVEKDVEEQEEQQEEAPEEAPEEKQEAPEEAPEEKQEAPQEDSTAETEADDAASAEDNSALSADVTDLQFSLDGKTYQLPLAFSELEADGWIIDPAESEFTNGYEIEANTKLIGSVDLVNPNYNEEVRIKVQFINNTDGTLDATKCDIWSFNMDVSYCDSPDSYPNMIVGNGITFGATKSDIESILGPCDNIYESESFTSLSYKKDHRDVSFNVYDDMGLIEIELSGTGRE